MADFEPSNKGKFLPSQLSYSPREMALLRVQAMQKVLLGLEAKLQGKEELPRWVLDRMSRSAQELTLVKSYLEADDRRKK